MPAPAFCRCGGERVAAGSQPLVPGDPALCGGFGRESAGGLRQRADPDNLHHEGSIVAMDNPIRTICHTSPCRDGRDIEHDGWVTVLTPNGFGHRSGRTEAASCARVTIPAARRTVISFRI